MGIADLYPFIENGETGGHVSNQPFSVNAMALFLSIAVKEDVPCHRSSIHINEEMDSQNLGAAKSGIRSPFSFPSFSSATARMTWLQWNPFMKRSIAFSCISNRFICSPSSSSSR
jgi:hypothetical protein